MKTLEKFLDKFLGPVANFMSGSPFFMAMTDAFVKTTPITLGAAILLIIGNFPVESWIKWLGTIGLTPHFAAVQGAALYVISIYVVFNFAYAYTKRTSSYNPQIAGLLAIAGFILLMPLSYVLYSFQGVLGSDFPQQVTVTGQTALNAISQTYTGGEGIIVAILVGYLTARLYKFFNDKNIVIKMPESVPLNVSESLRPSILAGLIFAVFFLIRLAFAFAPFLSNYGNIFNFITVMIQTPLLGLVSQPAFLIFALTLANVIWYFGIHPQVIYSILTPMLVTVTYANIVAAMQGAPIPYLNIVIIGLACGTGFGGQGGTLGLIIAMIGAKSARYKQMFRLSAVPSLFNINEPLIFGMPIIMNPYFFFPMLLSPLLMGLSGYLMSKLITITYNPIIAQGLPWTTNAVLKAFVTGGVQFVLIALVALAVSVAVWYPFFRIADNKEYKIECDAAKANQ